ncbi:MAG: carboxypeptidase regulatory-like domain-containing protein [Acidobacteriia bacterium]|nr:carboxypeptidase regulatory-like domain-containing protein [Terriglobia bacterium]
MSSGRVAIALAFCLPLWGQSNLGVVGGVVQDPQQRPVQNARIEIVAAATGASRSTLSDAAGRYEIAGLAPGEYKIDVAAPGFATFATAVRLEVGQQMQVDAALKLGDRNDTVLVVAATEALKTKDPSLGEVVESTAVHELPLNGRMLIDLALTVPGAHLSHGAQTGDMNPLYWRPGQRSAISVGGSRPNGNYFLLDGVTNTDPTFNTLNLSPSPDAVQEFQVQTGSYSAELGGAGGGQINVITRSGSNRFHGTAYAFLRNNKFDARNFNEMAADGHLVQNQFGASVGGPILKKTFFFANYEGMRQSQNMTMIDTVPSADEAGGDFSMAGTAIFNPFSSQPNSNYDPAKPISPANPKLVRDPFPGNQIPAQMLSSVATTMLNRYAPRPNMMGDMGMNMTMMGQPTVFGSGMDSNNYTDVRTMRHQDNQGTVRIDRVFDRGDSIFGRYSLSSENGFTPENLPGFGSFHDNLAQHANVSWNRVASPSLVNTASVALSRLVMHRYSQNNASNDIVSQLGIQGVGFGGAGAYGAPWFNIQGYSGLGDYFAATPVHAWDTTVEGRDSLSWQRGAHSLKFGGSYRWYIWPMWGFFQNRGYYQFTSGFTTQTATSDGTGSALASFLLGLPAVRQRQAGIPSMDLRQWSADAFAQDEWHAGAHTTLTFGLRYEYASALADLTRPWGNLELQNGGLVAFIGGQNGMPRGLTTPGKLRFAPRFGIAHTLPSGFVFRGAYGIFYTPVDLNTWCNQLHNVPLVFPETNQSDNFVPSITSFDFAPPVLGKTVVSYAAFDAHPPSQYIEQWSGSVEKAVSRETVVEIGYQGARGFHLQRAHLINNAPPGPGLIQPRRPYHTATFAPGTVFPAGLQVAGTTFPISGVNMLENTARSWYELHVVQEHERRAGFPLAHV